MTIEITEYQRAIICYGLACAKSENVHYLAHYPKTLIKENIEKEIESIDEMLDRLLYHKTQEENNDN